MTLSPAPPLQVAEWLNSDKPMTLEDFRDRALFVLTFQLLCPGCVQQAIPQARKVAEMFNPREVAVIGLHSVFEHHEAQGRRDVLTAFLHENKIRFPVAIDQPGDDGVPLTFRSYGMRGTPTYLLINKRGELAMQHFGHADDMALGSAITRTLLDGRAA